MRTLFTPRNAVLLFLSLLLVVLPSRSPAPVFGLFPGFPLLVEQSDAVVLVQVLDEVRRAGEMESYGQFRVGVVKSFKGAVKEREEATMMLRFLFRPVSTTRRDPAFDYDPFVPVFDNSRYFLVFASATRGLDSDAAQPADSLDRSLNYEGSVIPISHDVSLRLLDGKPIGEQLRLLMEDSMEQERSKRENSEARLREMMESLR